MMMPADSSGFKTKPFGRWLMLILGVLAPLVVGGPCARAATGIRALDEPAIPVLAANKVPLVAITRAGNRLVAVGVHGVICFSDDNGQSWTQARVPVGVLFTAVAFANPHDGWAAGQFGIIVHTADGGASWQVQLDGTQVNKLIADAANAAAAANPASDEAAHAVHRAGFFTAPNKPFLSILVTDANNVLVFGSYRMVVKTTDGGKSWVDWSLHVQDRLSHNLYDVTTVGSDIYVSGEGGHDFVSTDGGNSFAETAASPSPTSATMFGALDTGDNGVMLFGVAGQAYVSHDRGATWQTIALPTGQNLTAARTLASGAILLAAEDGALFESFDHAKTFTQLPQGVPMAIFDLQQAANGDVVIVGNLGITVLPAGEFSKT